MSIGEKRSHNLTTVADAVYSEVVELDQEGRAESELAEITVPLGSESNYLKHLSNLQAHDFLLHDLEQHTWRLKQALARNQSLDYMNKKLKR
jgi:hypothetical protein